MECTATTRDLDGIARDLLAPLLAGGTPEPGWTLAGWDAEQGICLLFEGREAHILLEFDQRNDRLDCYARTARFNVCARRQFGDRSMSDADRRLVDAVIALVREREARLPAAARPPAPKVAVREVRYFGARVRHLYDQHGLGAFAAEAYASPTVERLTGAFGERVVASDPLDDFEPLHDW